MRQIAAARACASRPAGFLFQSISNGIFSETKKAPVPHNYYAGTRAIHFYNTPAVPPGLARSCAHSCILTYACFDNGVESPACLLMPYIPDCCGLCHARLTPRGHSRVRPVSFQLALRSPFPSTLTCRNPTVCGSLGSIRKRYLLFLTGFYIVPRKRGIYPLLH